MTKRMAEVSPRPSARMTGMPDKRASWNELQKLSHKFPAQRKRRDLRDESLKIQPNKSTFSGAESAGAF
jgi:hypothetical protein